MVRGMRLRGSRHKLIQEWFREDMRKTFPLMSGQEEQVVLRGYAISTHGRDDWINPCASWSDLRAGHDLSRRLG